MSLIFRIDDTVNKNSPLGELLPLQCLTVVTKIYNLRSLEAS